jgi:hypothetical protein
MNAHPLVEVREGQHHAETDWLSVAQEGIVQVLCRQDTVHANDLYELGLPDEACNVAGSAFASYLGKGWIASTGERRASTRPSRNCAKSFIYRATAKFPRPATAGVRTGVPSPQGTERWLAPSACASANSGDAGTNADGGHSHPSSVVSVSSGESSPGVRHEATASVKAEAVGSSATPGEQASLFSLPPARPAHDRSAKAA